MASKLQTINKIVKSPFSDVSTTQDMDQLIQIGQPKNAIFIELLKVKPEEQRRIPLGSFTEDNPPKGFLVQVDPDPNPADCVTTEITTMGDSRRYTLFLQIANYGTKTVQAEIWRL